MMTLTDVLFIIYVIVSILILLFLLLIVIPFHISLRVCLGGLSIEGVYRIAWLGITLRSGSISPPLPQGMMKEEDSCVEKKNVGRAELQESDSMRLPDPRSLLGASPAIVRVLRDLIRSIKFEEIRGRFSFGLEDPVETAVMSGYLWSALSAVGLHRANIFIEPYFGGVRLEGDFRAELQARVLWIFVAMLRALGEKKIRRLMIEVARGVRA